MKSSNAALAFLAFTLAAGTLAHGQVADLDRMVKESDVVAVAQVISTQQTGSGAIEFPQRQPISADFRLATLHLKQILKGTSGSTTIAVPYTILSTRGAAGVGGVPRGYTFRDTLTPNSTRLIFLKSVGDHSEFTNGSVLSVVCAPEASSNPEPLDAFSRVLSRITAALFSANVPSSERGEAIFQLGWVGTNSVIPPLRTFLQGDVARKDGSLRTAALVALLAHKDESVVDAAKSELLSGSNAYGKGNLLFAIAGAIPPSRSIPILKEVLAAPTSTPEMRTDAARAISDALFYWKRQ